MSSEAEIMSKFRDAAGSCRDACVALSKNADPAQVAPRGHWYGNIKRGLKHMEGCCRQMQYHRSDTRWLKLSLVFAKRMPVMHKRFLRQDWLFFRDAATLFTNDLVRLQDLATAKAPHSGVILPKRTDWLLMPDKSPVMPGIVRGSVH